MIFFDPKSGFTFKTLFGDIRHKDLLMSFLNNILNLSEDNKIVDVVFNNPHNTPETMHLKQDIIDANCTDQSKKQYIVEMQVSHRRDYIERMQFYSSLALSRQLSSNYHDSTFIPVIYIGILDFQAFETEDYITHHLILDTETHEHALKHMSFHFIELAKFNKKLEDLVTTLDKWIYFLKYAENLKTVPAQLNDPLFLEAFGLIEMDHCPNQMLFAYDEYFDELCSTIDQVNAANENGKKEGIIIGKTEGEKEGNEKGEQEKAIAIAKKLLKLHNVETVAEITELTVFKVQYLKNQE